MVSMWGGLFYSANKKLTVIKAVTFTLNGGALDVVYAN